MRRAVWKRKAKKQAIKSLSLAKSVLKNQQNSFVYTTEEEEESEN